MIHNFRNFLSRRVKKNQSSDISYYKPPFLLTMTSNGQDIVLEAFQCLNSYPQRMMAKIYISVGKSYTGNGDKKQS